MPLGLPVVPLVYSKYSMSSLSMGSGSQVKGWSATRSCHQISRPSTMRPSACSVRRSTTIFSTLGAPSKASSAFCLSGTMLPRLKPPSAMTKTLDWESLSRSLMASALKPPKTTLWGAPMRAQASMAMGSSGTMGM